MLIRRMCYLIMLVACLLGLLTTGASADEFADDYPVIALPEDFNFSQSENCRKHNYFHQAAACANGTFIVCSHHIDDGKPTDETFRKQYIDYYNADGRFFCEYSFTTTQAYVAELTHTSINLYFYAYTITISLDTGEVVCYDTPDCYVENNSDLDHLRKTKFTSGEWEYSYKKSLTGYTALYREGSEGKQEVVTMPGVDLSSFFTMIGVILAGGLCGAVIVVWKKKHKQ